MQESSQGANRLRGSRRLRGFEALESRQMLAVVINEIHYDPDFNTEHVEFIEFYNDGTEAVDLSGWRIDEAVDYTFPDGASIAANAYLVVTQDAAHFQAKFGFAPFDQWETGDKLSNEGETIELLDSTNALVDEVSYRPGFPWPTAGEFGNSLELIHPGLDNDLAGSWRSSGLASNANAGQTLVGAGSVWRYRKGVVADPPSNSALPVADWRQTGFVEGNDVVTWQNGTASIGYGDGDDATFLGDMAGSYSTIYARRDFTVAGSIPEALMLRMYVDDGAIVYINGEEVARFHVSADSKSYNSTTGTTDHEAEWEEMLLTGASDYLVLGANTIAVHAINSTISSSDFSFNLELGIPDAIIGLPTPGARNSVYSVNAAPQMRQLNQSVQQPQSGQEVVISIKATDPDGVQGMVFEYQTVDPGAYVRLTDAAYNANWTSLAMNDDGLNGDVVAGDDVYSITVPGNVQTNRRLVRYRITATDTLGASIQGPYADDPQPNFAYFVYDGVPDYTASLRPGFQPNVVYDGEVLDRIATYHLIANASDVQNSQYNPQFNEVLFRGTFVYDGVVYDHVEFRNRGVASTYQVGKNKWKIEFLNGHHLQARDNYGNPYQELWDEINVLPGTNPWWRDNVSTEGTVLFEPVAFKLYELAGAPSPQTNYFNFRVIDGASETGANQYSGDFWGLYIGIEQPDGSFLDERGLDDGNIYNMHSSVFGATNQRHQGSSVTDRSDLAAFMAGIDGGFETLEWWEDNLNWDVYFAWNIVNHVVNNSDIRPNENVNYYRNEVTGQWYVIPWDLDLTFEDAPHLGNPVTNRENIRTLMAHHPLAKLAYENRLREITDLLLDNGDAAYVVEELAGILTLGTNDLTIVNANQAMWDYHPQKNKKGIWYENFNPSLLTSETFAGLVDYMQDFVGPGGYGYNLVQSQGSDANIPATPSINYTGEPGFGVDQLAFQTTPYSDPQGAGTFAKMEWRIAEVFNSSVTSYSYGQPYVYEIEGTWESGELASFDSELAVPGEALEAGKTYRARVRMQDSDGHWSHWSDAYEFQTSAAVTVPSLVISEINYHPAEHPGLDDSEDLEFIEILNLGSSTVDLSGIQITTFASNPYVFSAGLSLEPGARILVARSPEVFQSVYGTGFNLAPLGYGTSNLSNGGESIALATAAGVEFFSFTYADVDPWPTSADGDGYSLEIIDPLGDANDPANWRASVVLGGTPGGPLAGDYQPNNRVDGRDFLSWQRSLGNAVSIVGEGADGNFNKVVDAGDLLVWQDSYGATLSTPPLSNGSGLNALVSSPEADLRLAFAGDASTAKHFRDAAFAQAFEEESQCNAVAEVFLEPTLYLRNSLHRRSTSESTELQAAEANQPEQDRVARNVSLRTNWRSESFTDATQPARRIIQPPQVTGQDQSEIGEAVVDEIFSRLLHY